MLRTCVPTVSALGRLPSLSSPSTSSLADAGRLPPPPGKPQRPCRPRDADRLIALNEEYQQTEAQLRNLYDEWDRVSQPAPASN